ncbi:MAG TPA: S41 family peptidase, partial [Planctomycetota bacterium]|nr:S41 family peptidase [Planctomycetota bacterium]
IAARDRLIKLVESNDIRVRDEAALTLAEMGFYEGGVREILRSLRSEPTERGRRARVLDRLMQLDRMLERRVASGEVVPGSADTAKLLEIKEGRIRDLEAKLLAASDGRPGAGAMSAIDRLLDEVIRTVQDHYVEVGKTTRESLVLRAIEGMVQSLDPYSVFMDKSESAEFGQVLDGHYPGMGAHVVKKEGEPLEILRPVYGGPAYRAGILSGDRVRSVDGVATADLTMEDLSKLLKGPEGSKITLEVERRGKDAPFTVEIVRETIELPSVHYEALPLGIGYIRLTQFGRDSSDEFKKALAELDKDGLEGLIIDLRDNGGGRLEVAVAITDLFVRGDMPIVSQKGRGGDEAIAAHYPTDDALTGFPIIVLVNEHSASASEIVAGALQDYGRAVIVGKRTFGKGSVQNLIGLRSRPGSQLKLTVQYYYLPRGRSVHTIRDENGKVIEEGGVKPDIEVEPTTLPSWRLDERARLRDRTEILSYVDRHFDELRKGIPLGSLAEKDAFPEIEELHKKLETRGTVEDVIAIVRYQTQRRIEDERGRQFAFDLPSDRQLQAALVELLKLTGKTPEDAAAYSWLPKSLEASAPENAQANATPSK